MGIREAVLLKQLKSWSLKDLAKSYKIRIQKSSDLEELFNYIRKDLRNARELDNEELYKRWHGCEKPKKQEHRYSIAKINNILMKQYRCQLVNTTGYKGNRATGKNRYNVVSADEETIIFEDCFLNDVGKWLEANGDLDYDSKTKTKNK